MIDGYIVLTSIINAPNTTIQVADLKLNFTCNTQRRSLNFNVVLFDINGKNINLPRPARLISDDEMKAVLSLPMKENENIISFMYRAAAPYIESVYGITYNIFNI